MPMKRWRNALLVALTIAIGGCGAAGATASTSLPSLTSTTVKASTAPGGAIPIAMTAVEAGPRFQPDTISAKAGTAVFFLENVPGAPRRRTSDPRRP